MSDLKKRDYRKFVLVVIFSLAILVFTVSFVYRSDAVRDYFMAWGGSNVALWVIIGILILPLGIVLVRYYMDKFGKYHRMESDRESEIYGK